jgi:3-hydroxyacyl-[acyl-carrier-protein] dehydratase
MLRHDFFTFTDLQTEGNIVKTDIKLNVTHPIFKGHFPSQAILPGVCRDLLFKKH